MKPFEFPGQQPDETVVLVLHRHWIPFLRDLLRIAMLAGLPPLLLWGGLKLAEAELDPSSPIFGIIIMAGMLFYLFLAILLYGFWLDYYLDVFVVTNRRVVDIEQRGLLSRTVAEQPLYRIQDVTSEINGAMAHIFHYGNVYIQTAGEKGRFFFQHVPNPENVVREILNMTEKMVHAGLPLKESQDEKTGDK